MLDRAGIAKVGKILLMRPSGRLLGKIGRHLELYFARQRHGPTGTITVYFDVAPNALRNFAEHS